MVLCENERRTDDRVMYCVLGTESVSEVISADVLDRTQVVLLPSSVGMKEVSPSISAGDNGELSGPSVDCLT